MIYNFMSGDHGLKNITGHRIKISRISDLNDPYELAGIAFSDVELVAALDRTKAQLDKTKGLICFSQDWGNPVMWSHCADRHRGICLGFERHGEDPAPVTYSKHLLTPGVVASNLECAAHMAPGPHANRFWGLFRLMGFCDGIWLSRVIPGHLRLCSGRFREPFSMQKPAKEKP